MELNADNLGLIIESICPSSLVEAMDRDRPYDGQPHTNHGNRGETLVEGLTFRDVRDCFIRGCYDASGLEPKDWPGSVHDLPWDDMDIIAVQQNMSCWMEKYMGIFPNVPRTYPSNPKALHWCGPRIDESIWCKHDGECDEKHNVELSET